MIDALIFDFDGLIVDTETPAFASWQQIYARHGVDLPAQLWHEALGTNEVDLLGRLADLLAQQQPTRPFDQAQARAEREALKNKLSRGQPLLPGVLALLDDAAAAGLPCAVASSSSRAWVTDWLDHFGLLPRFVAVCTADDVDRTKPAPDLFLLAAARLRCVPAHCLVLEDSPNGIRAARAAGMPCVAVPGAVASQFALPAADLRLASLADLPLADIIQAVMRSRQTMPPEPED